MKNTARLVLALSLALIPIAAVASEPPVKVFVTSAGTQNGFTDPSKDNADTVKDLRNAIRDQKSLALAESTDDAAIVLTVLSRETAGMTAGIGSVFGAPMARDRAIRVKFACQDIETELTASAQGGTISSGGAWGKAAKKIAKQVETWVTLNRAKLSATNVK
jgi:hypothetical protein